MMVRLVTLCALLLGQTWTTSFGVTVDNTQTYQGKVNDILAFITNKQDPTPGTGIDSWNNTLNTPAKTDTVAIFRLVTNAHVTLDTTTSQANQRLTQDLGGGKTETLATYYNLTSDGDGTTATGFLPSAYGSGIGSGNYLYVGGGSSAWETAHAVSRDDQDDYARLQRRRGSADSHRSRAQRRGLRRQQRQHGSPRFGDVLDEFQPPGNVGDSLRLCSMGGEGMMGKRTKRVCLWMVGCAGVILLARTTNPAPNWRTTGGWPHNPEPNTYTQPGLSTWNTSTATTDSDWPVRYRIQGINVDFTLSKVGTPSALTNSKASDTLATYCWLFTGDEYSAAPARTGIFPNLATYTSQGYNNPVPAASFMTSVSVKDVGGSDNVMDLYVTCRGINNENFGSASDATEAPDSGTYTTSLTLRITY